MDKPLGILPKTVLEIFYKNLDCPRDVMRIVKSVNDVMGEIFPINVDNLYLFMPISAKSKIDPLHCVFEKMQPDKNVCLCLIGVPNVIDYEFDSYVEFPPVANNWSVFEGL
jgi:hypothetical protein